MAAVIGKTRHAVPTGLTADVAAVIVVLWMVRPLFG
jgi:spore maturation protein SpmB